MQLTSHQAQAILEGAQTRSREIGVPVNIAVLDAGAHLKAFSRMDGAVLGSIDVAMRKARTAALFQTTQRGGLGLLQARRAGARPRAARNGGLAPFAGGIPLEAADGDAARRRRRLRRRRGAGSGDRPGGRGRARPLTIHPNTLRPSGKERHMSKTILITGAGSGFGEGRRHRHGQERPQRHRHRAGLAAGHAAAREGQGARPRQPPGREARPHRSL